MKAARRILQLLATTALWIVGMAAYGAEPLSSGWTATLTRAQPVAPELGADLGRLPTVQIIHIAVALQLRDRPGLDAVTDALATGGFGRTLGAHEFLDRHAPTVEQAARVADYLRARGFRRIVTADNRLLVSADGTPAQVEAAFQTQLHGFDVGGRAAFANVTDAQVPTALGDTVLAVIGLQTVRRLHPLARRVDPLAAGVQSASPQAVVGVPPQLLASLYGAAGMPSASTSTIGIVTQGSMTQTVSDLQAFAAKAGYPAPDVRVVTVGAASGDTSGIDEWNLDTQTALAAAGGTIRSMLLYTSPTLDDANLAVTFNRAVSDRLAQVVNVSLGGCELDTRSSGTAAAIDQIFQAAAAQGQTFSVASGDAGAFECGGSSPQQSFPAVSPYVMAIGGTTLSSSGGTWLGETAWSCADASNCARNASGGTGGGVSSTEPAPSWQTAAGVLTTPGRRGVPDIAFDAAPSSGALILIGGSMYQIGGTSLSAPLFTGFYARVQAAHGNGLGFPAPALYAGAASHSTWFHDVVSGSNGAYAAGAGWDYVTGFGSLQVQNFSSSIAGGSTPTPGVLANEGQTFTLNGTQTVRYGSGASAVTLTLAGGGTCSNSFFGGDPLPGVVKQCQLVAAGPINWTTVAAEGQSFAVSATQLVRYGSGSNWILRNVSGTAGCSNTFFGTDPLRGTVKQCQLASSASVSWSKVAGEGQTVAVPAARTVRFGSGSAWITRVLTSNGACTNAAFGRDPVVGVVKECDVAN